jgi:hypothetical protein
MFRLSFPLLVSILLLSFCGSLKALEGSGADTVNTSLSVRVVASKPSRCFLWDFYEVQVQVSASATAKVAGSLVLKGSVLFSAEKNGTSSSISSRVIPIPVDGFQDGPHTFRVRVYCQWPGMTKLSLSVAQDDFSEQGPGRVHSSFTILEASRPGALGKLRVHREDPFQFVYDSGAPFLHFGDTGYRFLIPTEPLWQRYIDQAATVQGATKVRAWLASGRSSVRELVDASGTKMNFAFWQEVERRLLYSLRTHPHVQVQVIVYGEDEGAIKAAAGSSKSIWAQVASYAQARFSSFANVQWCVINDVMAHSAVSVVASAMAAREPWGTLLTSHQRRQTGYAFVGSPWSDIVTLQTLDAFAGTEIGMFRASTLAKRAPTPVVLEEDRYETYKRPTSLSAPDWFRMFFWSAMVAGGHATYGGIQTWLPYQSSGSTCSASGPCTGVRGYGDMVGARALRNGARDWRHIKTFFAKGPVSSLVGFQPGSAQVCGGPGRIVTCSFGPQAMTAIVYLKARLLGSVDGLSAVSFPLPRSWQGKAKRLHTFNPVSGTFGASTSLLVSTPYLLLQCAGNASDCVFVFT